MFESEEIDVGPQVAPTVRLEPLRARTLPRWWILCVVGVIGIASYFLFNRDNSQNGSPRENDLTVLAAKLTPSVLKIEGLSADGQVIKSGTGFFVSEDGCIATCAHVISGSALVRVSTLAGAEFKFRSVLKEYPEGDLALLNVVANGAVPFRSPERPSAEVGMPIAVLGNPLGLNGSFSIGVISAVRSVNGSGKLLQISAPVSPGSSGAPVVNMSGELIGMVGARANGGEGIGFALPAEEVWKALEESKVSPKVATVDSFAKSRKRHMPGPALAIDNDWLTLPDASSQRLAVLRRLRSRFPNEAIVRIQIAEALRDENDYEASLAEVVSILQDDPSNRLAIVSLQRLMVNEEKALPLIRAAILADPLNFRARMELVRHENFARDYSSAAGEAERSLDVAPFYLRSAEACIDAHLGSQMRFFAGFKGWFSVASTAGRRRTGSLSGSSRSCGSPLLPT